MAFQKVFKKAYAEKLYEEARNGIGQERYYADKFEFDEEQTYYAARVIQPEGLAERMPIDDDYAAAIELYKAYEHLTPLQASDHAFWIYLAHADLYPYVKKRFNKLDVADNKIEYITTHWFFGRELVRNALAGLWWNVYCTVDEGAEDIFKYTRFLFSQYDLRMISFANYKMFRHKEQAIGMLSFWMDHPEAVTNKRSRYFTKHFNKLGGTKQLVCLNRDFFYKEMERILPEALNSNEDEADIEELEHLSQNYSVNIQETNDVFSVKEDVFSEQYDIPIPSDSISGTIGEDDAIPLPFEDYEEMFSSLNVNKMKGYIAPHKAVLLYAIISLIETGHYESNLISLDDELETTFENIWFEKVGLHPVYKCSIENPFYHMEKEPFWTLRKESGWTKKNSYGVSDLKKYYKGGELNQDLFEYLQEEDKRYALQKILEEKYFS